MWNYRILEETDTNKNKWYSLREVYYNEKDEVAGYSAIPKACMGETVDELIVCIRMMLKDAEKSKNDILIDGKIECKGFEDEI